MAHCEAIERNEKHMKASCPCGSQMPYATCCQRLHDGHAAPNAERLMRSRYSAYVLGLADYLKQSWHATTRPDDLEDADLASPQWLGLTIVEASESVNHETFVHFRAAYQDGEIISVLDETSRFVFENGHWFYIDGVIHPSD